MTLEQFDALVGGGNCYVRCKGKIRTDKAIVDISLAKAHIQNGGQIGWWVQPGYIVVDIDEGRNEALKIVKRTGLRTLMCKTPKGLHLYFKTELTFVQHVGMVLPYGLRCDFRCANKGYVLLPFGSDDDRALNNSKKVIDMPREYTPLSNRKDSLYALAEGEGRNALLFSHLMAYKNHGATEEQVEDAAYIINEVVFEEPISQKELQTIVGNTGKYEAAIQGENPYVIYNDKGRPTQINHRAICDYFVNLGTVFVLGGECFKYEDGVYGEASSAIRNEIKDMIEYDHLINQNRIMECFRLVLDDTRLQRNPAELNADKNLINFRNGVWNIRDKRLMKHDHRYLHTLQIPHDVKERVPFKDTALCKYLRTCKLPTDDIKMIIKYMAYCLTMDYGLKTFMILCGPSNTGKSVLIRFLENLVGKQNTSALSMHELNMRFYPSQLYSKFLNACADNSSLPLSSIENLKKITGGDQIMHEKKGKDPFFFVSFAKLIFSFNQLPLQLEEKSNAFYKRMRILSMEEELYLNNAYVEALCSEQSMEEVIPFLLAQLPLKAIPRTKRSNELVEGLRQDSDSIHAFIEKRCEKGFDLYIEKDNLYTAYVDYCIATGREAHKKQGFYRHMKSSGYKEFRTYIDRSHAYRGLALKKRKKRRNTNG